MAKKKVSKRSAKPVSDEPAVEPASDEPAVESTVDESMFANPDSDEVMDETPPAEEFPPIPTVDEVTAAGYSDEAAAGIIAEQEALHKDHRKLVMVPALRVTSKRPRTFWCCQLPLESGIPHDFEVSKLTEAQHLEIETKRGGNLIVVEEIELEVEVDDVG